MYIVTENEAKRADKFWRCSLKTGKREMLYHEKDELFDLSVSRSTDNKFLFCESSSKTSAEARVMRLDKPGDALTVVRPREPDHEYRVDEREEKFYILTNKDAKNFRLVSAPVDKPTEWTEVIPHHAEVKLEEITLFKNFMAVTEREAGQPYLRLFDFTTGKRHRLDMPEPLCDISPDVNLTYDTTGVPLYL